MMKTPLRILLAALVGLFVTSFFQGCMSEEQAAASPNYIPIEDNAKNAQSRHASD